MIVLFTNQSKAWKIEQIHNVIDQLNESIHLFADYAGGNQWRQED